MPRPKPWLKMWVEWIGDPKLDSLSLAEQGAWWRLVSLAHQCADEGRLTVNGVPLSPDEIMKTLKITTESDRQAFVQMVHKMEARKSLHWNSNTLVVSNYKTRQEMVPSNQPEAVLARQQKHRRKIREDKKEREPERKNNRGIYTEVEKRCDVTAEMSQKSRDTSLMTEISRLYEEYIGNLTSHVADQIREYADNYAGEISWLRKAFVAGSGKRSWPYVAAILDRYQEQGGPDDTGTGSTRQKKPDQARRSLKAPTREQYRRSLTGGGDGDV